MTKNKASLTHDISHCFSDRIGTFGLEKNALDGALLQLETAVSHLASRKPSPAAPLLAVTRRSDDIEAIENLAAVIRGRFKQVVVAGAGGSGLSGRTLVAAKPISLSPRLYFLETIDPDAIDDLLAQIDLAHTCFIIISKSGSTAETLGQFYVLTERVKKEMGEGSLADQFIVITMDHESPLRENAKASGMRIIDHEHDIGGRFSIFTAVGLLSAAIAGMDVRALRGGAASVVKQLEEAKSAKDFAPAIGAALQYSFLEKGRNISVMLPYSERLGGFSSWYRQSWAESLGKSGKGSTPIRAVGTTDQHSQLQLYLDGPKDKLFHLITLARKHTGQKIPALARKDLAYISGKTTGDIMEAEQKATLETLVKNGCPVRVFTLSALNEHALGALLMHFTLEIIFMAELLGVNAFDQPAVEESKILARDWLLTGTL